jgi:hypothetical protein
MVEGNNLFSFAVLHIPRISWYAFWINIFKQPVSLNL